MSSLCPIVYHFLSGSCEVNYSSLVSHSVSGSWLLTALSGSALVRLMLGLCLVQMSGLIQALVRPDIFRTCYQ